MKWLDENAAYHERRNGNLTLCMMNKAQGNKRRKISNHRLIYRAVGIIET